MKNLADNTRVLPLGGLLLCVIHINTLMYRVCGAEEELFFVCLFVFQLLPVQSGSKLKRASYTTHLDKIFRTELNQAQGNLFSNAPQDSGEERNDSQTRKSFRGIFLFAVRIYNSAFLYNPSSA